MNCLNCGSEEIKKIELEKENVIVCKFCGYGRPSIQTPIQYTEAYEAKYLSYPEKDICDIRLKCLLPPINPVTESRRTLLDFGCGSGAFVRAARERGYDAYGLDVNDFTADLRPPVGFSPNIITAWDSFEHLTDEQQKDFFKLAKDTKLIVLSVPDFETPKKDETLSQWRHYRPGEHLHYYIAESLRMRMLREGFNCLFMSHAEDAVRKAPWKNNILTMGFVR